MAALLPGRVLVAAILFAASRAFAQAPVTAVNPALPPTPASAAQATTLAPPPAQADNPARQIGDGDGDDDAEDAPDDAVTQHEIEQESKDLEAMKKAEEQVVD